MKSSKWIIGSILLATLGLGGCAIPSTYKGDEISVILDIVPTEGASVSEARVVQRGEELVISGKVKKYHEFFLPGHVDIVVCDTQGTAIAQETPRLTGYASKRGGVKEGRFSARLRLTPPAGSVVHVKHHAPASGEPHSACN